MNSDSIFNMKKYFSLFFAAILIYFASCSSETPTTTLKLYNTGGLIRKDIVQLNKNKARLIKSADYNGNKENIQLDSVNWNKELELITASNISEKYLSYSINSTKLNNDSVVTYSAKESKLDVRKMTIVFNQGVVKKLTIERMKENAFYYSKQEIEYVPQTYFSIYTKEKMILSDTTYYRITGVIN